jgi:WD40 repeat protein
MNGTLPTRDRGYRESASGRTPGRSRTMPGAGRLVVRVANPRRGAETRKAAGVESGGWQERARRGSRFDGVNALLADLLAGYDQPVLLRERAPGTQHGPGGVFQPAHLGHNLLQRCPARLFQHCNNQAVFTAFAGGASLLRGGRDRRLFRAAGLLLRARFRRRHVGRLWRNGGRDGGFLAFRNARCRRIKTPQMERDEAVEMLLGPVQGPPADVAAFRTLAGRLGEWPLMLKLARGALKQRLARGDSISGALLYLNRALDQKGFTVFDSLHAAERHSGLGKTLNVSLDLLEPMERQCCFELSVFPEDVDIPLNEAAVLWGLDAFETEQLAERLDGLSLLEFDLRRGTVRLHDLMRGYFRGKLAAEAPAHQKLIDAWGNPGNLQNLYPWRWYIFHLTGAGQNDTAIQLMHNFDWLQKKLEHVGINALMADYEYVRSHRSLLLIRSAIRLSAHAVNADSTQFASQLLGRLAPDSPEVKALLDGATHYSKQVWLRPLCASLTQPGGPILRLLTGHEGPIRDVAVSGDGLRVVSASSVKDEVKIWDVNSWSEQRTLTGHTNAVNAVDVSSDGRRVLSGSDDCTARLWNADTGDELSTFRGHTAAIRSVALADTTPRGVTGSFDGSVILWDTESGLALRTFSGHEDWVRAVVITSDGLQVVSSSMDCTIRVWDALTGTEVRALRLHEQPARALALCPQSPRLLSGADDGSLRIWNLDGSGVRTLCESGPAIQGISVTADGKRAISLNSEDKLQLWDLEAVRAAHAFEIPAGNVNTVAISPEGVWAITGSHDETLRVWDLESELVLWPKGSGPAVHGHRAWVNAVAISADGLHAVSGAYDGTLKIWDAANGVGVHNITTQGGAVRAVAIAGGILISGSEQGPSLSIRAPATGDLLRISPDTAPVNSVATDGSGQRGVSGSPDGVLRIWDLSSCMPSHTIRAHSGSILAVSMNDAGTLALSASSDATVKCWDVQTGRELHTLRGHTDFVRCVSVSRDGTRAISGASHGSLKVWDLSSGSELFDLKADTGTVNSVAMTSGRHRALSGSGDHTVRLWDLDSARPIATFTADDVVTNCAISGDCRTIVAGDASGAVHFLRIEADDGGSRKLAD